MCIDVLLDEFDSCVILFFDEMVVFNEGGFFLLSYVYGMVLCGV